MAIITRPIEDFHRLVLPYASECPYPMVCQSIRLAAIEFCERTRCWRYVTNRTLSRDTAAIVAPSFATIFEIEKASWEDGTDLQPTQFSDVEAGADLLLETGTPQYVTQNAPNSVTVIPFMAGVLTLSLFLKPKAVADDNGIYDNDDEDINVLPDFLFVQHGESIAAGALARILALPHQPYTDLAKAGGYNAIFNRAMDTHFASNLKGQHRAVARSRPHYF